MLNEVVCDPQERELQIAANKRLIAATGRHIMEVRRGQSGGCSDSSSLLCEFIEGMVKPGILHLFRERGIMVHEVWPDTPVASDIGATGTDLLIIGDTDVVLVYARSLLTLEHVHSHVQRLANLSDFKLIFPRYTNFRAMGAVAAILIPNEVRDYAYTHGLFVLAQTGDDVAILNPANFQPQCW